MDAEEDKTFQLVDTTNARPKRFVAPARRRQQQNRLRQLNARNRQATTDEKSNRYNQPQRTRRRNNWGRGGGRGFNRRGHWAPRVERQASVAVRPDWDLKEEFDLNKLTKLRCDGTPVEEDLLWCGFLDQYNDIYDKVSTKSSVPLKRSETKEFYPVTTMDDPVVEKLAIDDAGNVFATDAILAHLMSSPRSIYPWDIVVQKLPNGTIFFDKRDNSQFDYLTVNETANIPPVQNDDDPMDINNPDRLSLEATMINQNFSQQILKQSGKTRKRFELPNPFYDEEDNDGMEPASVAFRYRKFTVTPEIRLVVRTELHGVLKKKSSTSFSTATDTPAYMTAFALNENPPKMNSSSNQSGPQPPATWRSSIDAQRGAVLATELKNNSYKLAKWATQSLLAGADQMKIGFVSRTNPKNSYDHSILATQFYRPKDFAAQMMLNVSNMWGIVKMWVELLRGMEEGKYVIMRDPNRNIVKLYKVPINSFEDDGSEDDVEEEEDEEEDE